MSTFESCKQNRVLQRAAESHQHGAHSAPAIVHDALRSSGQPLDFQTRTFMEGKFGHDFSRVRIFADEKAGASARAVNSLAYTVGNNLVFASGQYSPRTAQGTRLLAHELTHVVQQGGAGSAMQSSLTIGQPHDHYEQEADRMAAFVTAAGTTAGRQSPAISALPGGHVQRACASCEALDDEKEEK
jgi:hypothetical protein